MQDVADMSTGCCYFRHRFKCFFRLLKRIFAFVKHFKILKIMKKTFKFLGWMFVVLLTSVSFASCSDDDDEGDLADIVAGTYAGKLESGGNSVDDAYLVTLTRVTSTVVKVSAGFFDEEPAFNVENTGGQYKLVNTSNYSNVTMYVTSNGVLNISFVNGNRTMTVYSGTK